MKAPPRRASRFRLCQRPRSALSAGLALIALVACSATGGEQGQGLALPDTLETAEVTGPETGPADTGVDTSAPAGADARTDGMPWDVGGQSVDAAEPLDAQPSPDVLADVDDGLGAAPDIGPDASTDASTDAGADAAADAGPSDPLSHCSPASPLPPFAASESGGVRVSCQGQDTLLLPWLPGVVRVLHLAPSAGLPAAPPDRQWAVVAAQKPGPIALSSVAGAVELCTPEQIVRVDAKCRLRLLAPDGSLLSEDGTGGGWLPDTKGGFSLSRATPAGERFYGLGERNGPLDRRGGKWTFYNTDAYDPAFGGFAPAQDPLYANIPLLLARRPDGVAWGMLFDVRPKMTLDLAKSVPDRWTLQATGGVADTWLFAGPGLAGLMERYTALTGRSPRPPRWALGYHQCRWGYKPQAQVLAIAQELRQRKIPADGMWLDIQHMDGFRSFSWHPQDFNDPKALLSQLTALGFHTVAIVDPGLKVDPGWKVYDQAVAGGHFLKAPGGQVYTAKAWPGLSAWPDLSRAATRSWWAALVADFVQVGLAGIWLDLNEPTTFPESGGGTSLPDTLAIDGDGAGGTMADGHAVYALDESRATRQGLLAGQPAKRPFILSRAGYAGIQRTAAVWTGDVPSTWEGLQGTLPMLLGLGLSGVPLVGSDVGGYSGSPGPELFARWMALGVGTPLLRNHVTQGPPGQEPWQHGPEVEAISRGLIGWRYELLPYLDSLMDEAARTGAPPLRPLVWHFQQDDALATVGDEAMLGPFLLLAPVLEKGAKSRVVTLPAGRWFELQSGAAFQGPQTFTLPLTLAALPRYVRQGAILPMGPPRQHTGEQVPPLLRLDLYPGEAPSSFALYEDAGEGHDHLDPVKQAFGRTPLSLLGDANGATLLAGKRQGKLAPPTRPVEVRIRRVDQAPTKPDPVRLDGVALPKRASLAALRASPEGWWWDPDDLSLWVRYADRDGYELRADFDPKLVALAPEVQVPLEVHVPQGTPTTEAVHVTAGPGGWKHVPLSWKVPGKVAVGTVKVPRGGWFEYKYSRGGWCTVEKWPGCKEADNRYGLGAAHPLRVETVALWRDACDPCP